MRISSAEFLISSSKISGCPEQKLPEYAFIGRSNVGKSSLINMLCGRKDLAKISGKPGKTRLINHFVINESWYLVDLPGYGYAKASKKARKSFSQLIEQYFLKRENMMTAFVLLDARHPPQKIDLEFMVWLGEHQIPFSMVFTKIDKLSSAALQKNLAHYRKEMLKVWEELPPIFRSSASSHFGKDEILGYVQTCNPLFKPTKG